MNERRNRIIAGTIGGMAGGAMIAVAFAVIARLGWTEMPREEKARRGLSAILHRNKREQEQDSLPKRVAMSAALGGFYGAMRSGLNLPGVVSGPAFGIASLALSKAGLGPALSQTPGPWNAAGADLPSRLVAHTFYGTVTDWISEMVENRLSGV